MRIAPRRAALLAVMALCGGLCVREMAALAAGFTETVPKGVFLVDEAYNIATLKERFDNEGNLVPLIDKLERYEPGGSKQGDIIPKVDVRYEILANVIQYGILDNLTAAVGIPVVVVNTVEPDLGWEVGDYQWTLGRPYSEQDFWQWALSMGQPKPGDWSGNEGALCDIVLGVRYRFTDSLSWFDRYGLAGAVTLMGALPTGKVADPEDIVAAGTTSWDLHFQGDVCAHLSVDKFFPSRHDSRFTLGLDLFYEALLPHEYVTPRGTKNPLLLNYRPYVGDTYTIDPGDFAGVSFQVDIVPWKGPARATWITKGSLERAEKLPPLLTLTFRYTYTHLGQSDWQSRSADWDWQREKDWRPGYKNILYGKLMLSLLRIGLPLQPYVAYRDLSLIPGKNCRATRVVAFGLSFPAKFW